MRNQMKLALVAGVLAGATFGCSKDGASGATGPDDPASLSTRASQPAAAMRQATLPVAPHPRVDSVAASVAGYDIAAGPFSYRGPDGHLYEVRFGVNALGVATTTQHFRDGQLIAVGDESADVDDPLVSVYVGGVLLMSQDVLLTGATSAPAVQGAPRSGPMGTKLIDPNACKQEWIAYAVASANLLAAAQAYMDSPTPSNELRLVQGIKAFYRAFRVLLNCRLANP